MLSLRPHALAHPGMGGDGLTGVRRSKMGQPKLAPLAGMDQGRLATYQGPACACDRQANPKDDPVIAAAVAARAGYLVACDKDLLDLRKPYGIHILKPRAFVEALIAGS